MEAPSSSKTIVLFMSAPSNSIWSSLRLIEKNYTSDPPTFLCNRKKSGLLRDILRWGATGLELGLELRLWNLRLLISLKIDRMLTVRRRCWLLPTALVTRYLAPTIRQIGSLGHGWLESKKLTQNWHRLAPSSWKLVVNSNNHQSEASSSFPRPHRNNKTRSVS